MRIEYEPTTDEYLRLSHRMVRQPVVSVGLRLSFAVGVVGLVLVGRLLSDVRFLTAFCIAVFIVCLFEWPRLMRRNLNTRLRNEAEKMARRHGRFAVELGDDGICIEDGDRLTSMPWSDIESVEGEEADVVIRHQSEGITQIALRAFESEPEIEAFVSRLRAYVDAEEQAEGP